MITTSTMSHDPSRSTSSADHDGAVDPAVALDVLLDALREAIARRPEVADALIALVRSMRDEEGATVAPDESAEADSAAPEPRAAPPRRATTRMLSIGGVTYEIVVMEEAGAAVEPPAPRPPVVPTATSSAALDAPAPAAPADPEWRRRRTDLDLVVRRCAAKVRSIDWALERRERIARGEDHQSRIGPIDQARLAEVRDLADCSLWMLDPYGPVERLEPRRLIEARRGYVCVGRCAEAAKRWQDDDSSDDDALGDALPGFLQLAAEAQSALRTALRACEVENDSDQLDLWGWVRRRGDEERIYIERYMRSEDPATMAGLADFDDRLEAMLGELDGRIRRRRDRNHRINRLRYHAERLEAALVEGRDAEDPELAHDWRVVAETVEAWIAEGNQATDRSLLGQLAPIAADLPDAYAVGHVGRVLTEVERWLDDAAARSGTEAPDGDAVEADEAPASVAEAIDRVLARHPGRFVEAWNSRSQRDYAYVHPREVEHALEWLATDAWRAKRGDGAGELTPAELDLRLRERCGWTYRTGQSRTTMGQYPDWYRCSVAGRTFELREHVGRGNTRRQGQRSIRLAFAWDAESERIVLGFIGQHQRTGQS